MDWLQVSAELELRTTQEATITVPNEANDGADDIRSEHRCRQRATDQDRPPPLDDARTKILMKEWLGGKRANGHVFQGRHRREDPDDLAAAPRRRCPFPATPPPPDPRSPTASSTLCILGSRGRIVASVSA